MAPLGKKIQKLHGSSCRLGAHHPHCRRHHNHLIWFFGHPLCLGCTCMYSGIFTGALLAWNTDWFSISFFSWVGIHLLPIIPTALQPWIQIKPFKIMARSLLGVSVGSYVLSGLFLYRGIFQPWIFRLLVIAAFLICCKALVALRLLRPNNPCTSCPLGVYPTCEWNLPRLLANNDDLLILQEPLMKQISRDNDAPHR